MQGETGRTFGLVSHRCETFENLSRIVIAPVRRTLSGNLHSKHCDCYQHKYICSFYEADQDTARYSFWFSLGKMCKFSRTLYNRHLIQFARIPVEFVVRFIRCQNRVTHCEKVFHY